VAAFTRKFGPQKKVLETYFAFSPSYVSNFEGYYKIVIFYICL